METRPLRSLNGIYIAAAVVLFFAGFWYEKDAKKRKNRYRTAFVLSIAVIGAYINDFIGMTRLSFGHRQFELESNGLWKYNYLIIAWVVVFFVHYALKYGFLGIRLRVEEQKNEDSMRYLTQVTQILNHSIKNEILKIHYLTGRALAFLEQNRTDKAELSLTGISQVTDHLLEMVNRIKERADDLELHETDVPLGELIDSVLLAVRPLHPGEVEIVKDFAAVGQVRCDPAHMREVFSNLLLNAFEALPTENGRLHIRSRVRRRKLLITITDNGHGIDKENQTRMFVPFFSTKKSADSYGLGLSYCFL